MNRYVLFSTTRPEGFSVLLALAHICPRCIKNFRLSFLTYGILSVNKRGNCITNKELTSRHECVFEVYTCKLDLPKRLAGCMLYTQRCSSYPHKIIFSTYSIVQRNFTACLVTIRYIVNCVSKMVLQVYNHYV